MISTPLFLVTHVQMLGTNTNAKKKKHQEQTNKQTNKTKTKTYKECIVKIRAQNNTCVRITCLPNL